MNRKIPLGAALAFIIIIVAVTVSITMIYSMNRFNDTVTALNERENIYDKFSEIDRIVRQKYLGTINEGQLLDSVARGYLRGTGDSYASYLTAEEFDRLGRTDAQSNVGIGAVLKINPDGYLLVGEVYPDSPAQAVGILPGDLIVRVDEVDLTLENSAEVLVSVEAPVGTKVMLTVRRGSEDSIKDITRREIIVPTVYSHMIPDTSVAYIRITGFTEHTANQFNRELDRLQSTGCRAIIFDLRDNTGGTLQSASRILDRLLPAGPLIAAVYKNDTVSVLASSDANWLELPMVTLVNANTSNEAELFVQVLKDFGKTHAVGVKTAGRSMMQETIQLIDGSAIRITVARYCGPSGINYEGVGIQPDYDVSMSAEVEDWRTLDHTTDPQLKKALEVATALVQSATNKGELPAQEGDQAQEEQAPPVEEDAPDQDAEDGEPPEEPADGETDEADDSSQPEEESR